MLLRERAEENMLGRLGGVEYRWMDRTTNERMRLSVMGRRVGGGNTYTLPYPRDRLSSKDAHANSHSNQLTPRQDNIMPIALPNGVPSSAPKGAEGNISSHALDPAVSDDNSTTPTHPCCPLWSKLQDGRKESWSSKPAPILAGKANLRCRQGYNHHIPQSDAQS